MNKKSLTMLAVGDVIMEKPDGELYLSLVAPVLKKGDVVVGQGEVLFTTRGINTFVEIFPGACLKNGIRAIRRNLKQMPFYNLCRKIG